MSHPLNVTSWEARWERCLPLLFLQVVFVLVSLFFIDRIPYNQAPDEYFHHEYNVKFMLTHHRLPVSGVDDLAAYRTNVNRDFGRCSTQCSYVVYPAPGYVTAALSAWWSNRLFGSTYYVGARLASLAWGFLYITFLYLTLRHLTRRSMTAFALAFTFGFIPQVVFVSSYVNSDISALACSAFVAYFAVRWVENQSNGNAWGLAAAVGLLLSSKYNYVLYPPFLLILGACAWRWLKIPASQYFSLFPKVLVGILLLAVPWYLRNYYYYHDPFGHSFMYATMAKYHTPANALSFTLSSLSQIVHRQWFSNTFNSFFAVFGWMDVMLPHAVYVSLKAALGVWVLALFGAVFMKGSARDRLLLLLLVGFVSANVGLAIWNAMRNDYQAQGRHLFPSIIPIAAYLGYLCRRNNDFSGFAWLLAAPMGVLLAMSIRLLAMTYGKY